MVQILFDKTLKNVKFGILLMALTAGYIAIGSGVPSVRSYFEMTDLQFFNAWPLKVLMGLLVCNLFVVTFWRIPFTPPRYGVWLVHAGIVTLVLGTSYYYRNKVEGLTRIPVGQSVNYFYDDTERALYARIGSQTAQPLPLPGLPRFGQYDEAHGNASVLKGIARGQPSFVLAVADGETTEPQSLSEILGVPNLSLEVLEYHPYAVVHRGYVDQEEALGLGRTAAGKATGGEVGLRVTLHSQGGGDPHAGVAGAPPLSGTGASGASSPGQANDEMFAWLVGSDPDNRVIDIGGVELRHTHFATDFDLGAVKNAIERLHRVEAKVGGIDQTLFVQVGGTYKVGESGYSFKVESFDPAFPMSGTGEIVPVLTVMVTSGPPAPARQFRRMLLGGKTVQTDFLIDATAAGPMGKRQKAPIDEKLVLLYTLNDSMGLLPQGGRERHNLFTTGSSGFYDAIAREDGPGEVLTFAGGSGDLEVRLPSADSGAVAPFAGGASAATAPATIVHLGLQRMDHLRRVDRVLDVPPVLRDRDEFSAGVKQVIKVRVASGNWHQDLLVPFSRFAVDDMWDDPASSDSIQVPGAAYPFSLRLGWSTRALPAMLTLNRFDLVPYDGAARSGSQIMRDFRSTLTITDPASGGKTTGVAHLNNPVYFGDGSWLFFQAEWDPQGQRWTVLGIGNRPGVRVMVAGCVMIVVGLGYAFYLKPVIIARRKRKALRRAGLVESNGASADGNGHADGKRRPARELIST